MSYRKITVKGMVWEYTVGNGDSVIRNIENKIRVAVSNHLLKGLTPDSYERGSHKKTSDGMVTPKDIRKHIEEHLVK